MYHARKKIMLIAYEHREVHKVKYLKEFIWEDSFGMM